METETAAEPPLSPSRSGHYVPTPEQIREARLRIQAEWSPAEELGRRAGRQGQTWEVPEVGAWSDTIATAGFSAISRAR